MLYAVMYSLPSPAELFSSVGVWSIAIIDEFWPLMFYIAGIAVGIYVIMWIINSLVSVFKRISKREEE